MKLKTKLLFLVALILAPLSGALAQSSGLPVDVPRDKLFVMDQIFRYSVIDNYNLWVNGPHNPHRHALMMETFWIRDQETGKRIMDAAASDPKYNADFTQMDVDLRDNLYWSDGVQFTADDVVYTVQTLKDNDKLTANGWHTQLTQFLDSIEKTGEFSVRFKLTKPNARFHNLFEARWNGIYMMPKHVFEKIDDLATYTNNPPVVLGAYLPVKSDPNGYWELYKRRDDWQRTPAGIVTGNAGPENVLTIFYGDSAKKAIAMSRGELDVYFDADFEAFKKTLESEPTARSWYKKFPWAYPNEVSTREFVFNMEDDPIYQNKDVRWALALAIDIVDLQTTYIGGVAKVTPFPVPPTASLRKLYHDPLEDWLKGLEIDVGGGKMFKPYDPTVPDKIAAWAKGEGYEVPGTPREVFGTGWWKFAPDMAEALLVKNGFKRDANGKWLKPDGQPWKMNLQSPPDENDAFRMANAAADMWSAFGIDVNLQGLERSVWDQNHVNGQFQVSTPWYSMALASGDGWSEIRPWDPRLYVPVGQDYRSKGSSNNFQRINDPKIAEFLDKMAGLDPDSDANHQLVADFLKYWTEQMYFIPTISFKKFVTWDEKYWTGFPTAEHPDYMPLYWFQGGKFAIEDLKSTGK